MKQWLAIIVALSFALICFCSQGGTTDTGNARIAGVIHTPDGGYAEGALVTVCPVVYYSGIPSDSDTTPPSLVQHAITDAMGCFHLDSIDKGDWSIEVNDNNSGSAVQIQVTLGTDDGATIQFDTVLHPYAVLTGNIGGAGDTAIERYLVAYGLERRIAVARDGSFHADDLPAGTFHWRIIADREQWDPIELENVTLLPNSTSTVMIDAQIDKRGIDTLMIYLNTTELGADINEDVYGIPVLLRLTSDNFDFSDLSAGEDCIRIVKEDGSPLPFEIEAWDTVQQTASIWVRIDTVFAHGDTQYIQLFYGDSVQSVEKNSGGVFPAENGFLGRYHLSGSLTNSVSDNYHGIDSGTVAVKNGIISGGRSFDGATQFFSIAELPHRERGSISCWFQPKNTINGAAGTTQGIWGKKNEDEHDYTLSLQGADFYAGTGSPGKLISKLEDPDTGFYLSSTTATFSTGTWYYVAWVWGDGADSLYINGVLEAATQNCVALTGEAIEEVGRCHYDSSNIAGGGPRYFNGMLDEFRINSTVRSASWVKLCYMNQRLDDRLISIEKKE